MEGTNVYPENGRKRVPRRCPQRKHLTHLKGIVSDKVRKLAFIRHIRNE
jgi:hypothetical protein